MCRRLFHIALHPKYSLSLRIVWFATNILFILQDSLIRVTRRDEERKMLKEPTLVIVEHARSAWLIEGQCNCPPTVKPKAHPEHRLESRFRALSAREQFGGPQIAVHRSAPPVEPFILPQHAALFRPRPVNQPRAPLPPILFPLCKFRFF